MAIDLAQDHVAPRFGLHDHAVDPLEGVEFDRQRLRRDRLLVETNLLEERVDLLDRLAVTASPATERLKMNTRGDFGGNQRLVETDIMPGERAWWLEWASLE